MSNGIPETVRFDLDLAMISQIIVDELKLQGVFNASDDWVILDRAMASGQIVHAIERECILNNKNVKRCVYGCEMHKMDVQYAIVQHQLQGTYMHTGDYMIKPQFDDISFLYGERGFKLCEVGNYPYNDGSVNNNVIWNKFISDVRASQTDCVGVVVQASFLSQQVKGMAKTVKEDLISLGCYKIVINEYSDFDESKAKVKTCIIFCRKGYDGLVTYVERSTGRTVTGSLLEPFDMIFDPALRLFLQEVKNAHRKSFKRFPQYVAFKEKDKWAIGCYYKTEGFDKNPLKSFYLIPPNSSKDKNYYCVMGSAPTELAAKKLMNHLNSFWFNDAVQAILLLTRYQISLDSTQYSKVPFTVIDHEFSEDELFDTWGISSEARAAAMNLVKDCSHKRKLNAPID